MLFLVALLTFFPFFAATAPFVCDPAGKDGPAMPCPAVPVGGPVDPSGMGLDFPPVSPPVSTSASSSASSSPSASSPSSAASVTGKRSYVQRHSTSEVAAATLSGGSAAASPAGLAAASAAYSQPSSPSPSSSLSLSLDERMVRPMPGSVPSSPPGPVRPPSTLATNLTQSPPCVEQGHPPCRQLSCEEMAVSYDPDIAPGIPCRPLAELVFPGPEMDRVCKKIQPKIKAGIEVLPRVCGGTGVGAFSPPALPIDAGGGAAPPSDVGDVMEGIEGSKIGDGDGSMERRDGAGDGGVESIAVPSDALDEVVDVLPVDEGSKDGEYLLTEAKLIGDEEVVEPIGEADE